MDDVTINFELAREAYRGKIRTAAWRSFRSVPEHDQEDIEQELLLCLWETCKLYDPDRGSSFNSFFWMRARQRIMQLRIPFRAKKRDTSDIIFVEIDAEDMSHELSEGPSAEDEALAWETVRERLASA